LIIVRACSMEYSVKTFEWAKPFQESFEFRSTSLQGLSRTRYSKQSNLPNHWGNSWWMVIIWFYRFGRTRVPQSRLGESFDGLKFSEKCGIGTE
jgi:hypothetical protein